MIREAPRGGLRGALGAALPFVPLGVVLGPLFGGALLMALAQSLGHAPWLGLRAFPDASPYVALWSDPAFWTSVGLTLWYATVATALALALGLALALAMRALPGARALATVARLPLVVPYALGIALALATMGQGGLLSRLAAAAGWIDDPGQFPRLLHTHAGWGIVAVYVWKQTPFAALALLAVLTGLGREREEAAALLGAGRWTILARVVLPGVAPGLASAGLICFAFNMGAFEVPLLLGGGYPDTLPVLAWRDVSDADLSRRLRGMATVVSLVAISAAALWAWARLLRRWMPPR